MQAILNIVNAIKEATSEIEKEVSSHPAYSYVMSKNVRKSAQDIRKLAFDLRKLSSEEYKKTKVK